jgi:hypothetical protein
MTRGQADAIIGWLMGICVFLFAIMIQILIIVRAIRERR